MPTAEPHAPVISSVMIDCRDLDLVSTFWGELLGVSIRAELPGYRWLHPQREGGWSVAFQQVDERTPGKNRIHVDGRYAGDLEALTERIGGLGGRMVERQEIPGFVWNVYSDPEGNLFCLGQGR